MKYLLDKLTMLLSTDWFFDYWDIVGLDIDRPRRLCIRNGLRDIVQEFMSGRPEYWLISFSNERLENTFSVLRKTLKRCGVEDSIVERITLLIDKCDQSGDTFSQALIAHITELLANNDGALPPLESSLQRTVSEMWRQYGYSDPELFDQLCLESKSDWDRYIRSLTPDLPTMTSDFIMLDMVAPKKVKLLWTSIESVLPPDKRIKLLNWYDTIAK